jgi:ABC-2 type transport system ATP-binding protein
VIIYKDVIKSFGPVIAVNRVSMEIEEGCITALLGPNGSGKSTLMKMTIGVLRPDFGDIIVDGYSVVDDPISVRKIVGFSPEEINLFDSLTPTEIFSFLSEVYNISDDVFQDRVEFYVRLFKLDEYMNVLCGELSFGNRRKVSLVSALLHDPPILILDEPFSGLDPEAGRILKELLKKYASMGRTVVFSTHILEIAEAVANYIIIMNRGEVVARGRPDELRELISVSDLETVFMEVTGLSGELESLIRSLWGS